MENLGLLMQPITETLVGECNYLSLPVYKTQERSFLDIRDLMRRILPNLRSIQLFLKENEDKGSRRTIS